MEIVYLPYHRIDKLKWDACLDRAANSLIYGYSVYLDTMASHWDALVMGDYEVVMPLTWNKKYGICYLYQPFITASLGVFGNNLTAGLVNDFLDTIPGKFRYWDIYLNHSNRFHLKEYELYDRVNYTLPLNDSYEQIFDRFRINLKRSIRKTEESGCTIRRDIAVDEVLALAHEQSRKFSTLTTKDFARFKNLYILLRERQKAITYGFYLPSGQLVASCVLFFSQKRVYYILAGNHPAGKTISASHYLINSFIKDNSGTDLLLDFEGSDIPGLAFFYSSFGSTAELYVGLKRNKLPKLARLFKS